MRKLLLLFTLLSIFFTAKSQTLFTYGNHAVSQQEFLSAYNKNKEANITKENSLQNYLQLYIAYKLKVQAAKDLKMDTLPAFKADIANFKNQVEENFLYNQQKVDQLVEEAFARSQKDIHVIAYFIDTSSLGISSAGIKETMTLLKTANKNNLDPIIKKLTASGLKVSENDLGFITLFSLPYPIENIIYGLTQGSISAPYKVEKGFYIFKNESQRHAAGKIKVAQILISSALNNPSKSKKIADSIYHLLQSGADFSKLAMQESFDTKSAREGGVLEEFGVGHYDPAFENAAFSLLKDGDISKPFETTFGFHILKRISATPVSTSKEDPSFIFELKEKILNDKSRMSDERKFFLKTISLKTGFAKKKISEENTWIVTDSSLMENAKVTSGNVNETTTLFTFNDYCSNNVGEWISYVRMTERAIPGKLHESYKQLMPEFIDSCIKENYRKRLSELDPGFKQQMSQFTEENLLFEIMNTKIWDKAGSDTTALKNYYDSHKNKYRSESGTPIKNFEDARGLVVADYQDYLEEKWVNDLKKKYPVAVNQKVLDTMIK
ncbi:MAG: peptidylprolyl isomerase [Ginsengibacter sp.]